MVLENVIGYFGNKWNEISHYLNDDFTNSDASERQKLAAKARNICAWAGAMVAPQPIPIADIWIIMPIQYMMVRAIGNIYGYKITEQTVGEVFAVIGGGMLGQQACLALFKFGIPGFGGLFGAGFVFAWTHGIGYAAEAYFKSGMRATKEELAEARKRGEKEGKEEWKKENE